MCLPNSFKHSIIVAKEIISLLVDAKIVAIEQESTGKHCEFTSKKFFNKVLSKFQDLPDPFDNKVGLNKNLLALHAGKEV